MADVVSLLSSERLKWAAGQPVIFHHGKFGENIELSQNNSVVTSKVQADKSTTECGKGIAVTSEPVSVGVMLKVTVMKTNAKWAGGLVSQYHSYLVTQSRPSFLFLESGIYWIKPSRSFLQSHRTLLFTLGEE